MPDAGLATVLPAVASLGAAGMQANQAGQATAAQQQANQQALMFQMQQEENRRRQYDQAFNAWNTGRNALLSHFGVNIPQAAQQAPAPQQQGPSDWQMYAKDQAAQNAGQGGLSGFLNSQQGQMLQMLSPAARQGASLLGLLGRR